MIPAWLIRDSHGNPVSQVWIPLTPGPKIPRQMRPSNTDFELLCILCGLNLAFVACCVGAGYWIGTTWL